jgi:hypothetical protein
MTTTSGLGSNPSGEATFYLLIYTIMKKDKNISALVEELLKKDNFPTVTVVDNEINVIGYLNDDDSSDQLVSVYMALKPDKIRNVMFGQRNGVKYEVVINTSVILSGQLSEKQGLDIAYMLDEYDESIKRMRANEGYSLIKHIVEK